MSNTNRSFNTAYVVNSAQSVVVGGHIFENVGGELVPAFGAKFTGNVNKDVGRWNAKLTNGWMTFNPPARFRRYFNRVDRYSAKNDIRNGIVNYAEDAIIANRRAPLPYWD